MITMRRRSAAVANNRTWLTICGFTALLVVAAEAEDAFRLQDIGIPSASDYQGIALGDATDDVYLYLSRDKQQGQLYQWTDGRVEPVELEELEHAGSEAGAGWADYGSDGDLDLFVSRVGLPDLLYLNDNGVFSERASSLGVDDSGSGQGVSWVDYDQDGYVDLYVARFGQPNLLYAGQAESEPFLEQGVEVGLSDPGPSTGGAWGDFDADGDLDLYVVNHKRADHLYRHTDGVFERSDLAEDDGAGVGATWVDWDNDGDLDLSLARYGEPDRLLQNEGSEGGFRFTDIAPVVRLDDRGQGQMVAWGDYDLDGDPDAYVVNGGEARDVSRLYHNNQGSFTDASIETGLIDPTKGAARLGKAAIWWDYDDDGDLDLLMIARGEGSGLFENDGLRGKNGWLKVRMRDEGLGDLNWFPSPVIVHSGGRRANLSMSANSSYLSQGSQVVVVGLGRDGVDSVVVTSSDGDRSVSQPRRGQTLEVSSRQIERETDVFSVVVPAEIDFGEVSTMTRTTRRIFVTNNSESVIELMSYEFRAARAHSFGLIDELPMNISSGKTDSLTVVFNSPTQEVATAELVLFTNRGPLTVRLIGRSRLGSVPISPRNISLEPGEQVKIEIENQWTSAITVVGVLVPERGDIATDWQGQMTMEAGAKAAFVVSVQNVLRPTGGPLRVQYRSPNGVISQSYATVIVQRRTDKGGWSKGETYSVYGVIGVFLTFITHLIATRI